MNMLKIFLDILFRKNCAICQKEGVALCLECICGFERSTYEDSNIKTFFQYKDPRVRHAIHTLKYKRDRAIGNALGEAVFNMSLSWIPEKNFLVIPIPLSKKRLYERGFNQAEAIARSFCNLNKDKFSLSLNVLVKMHETRHQARIKNKNERKNNLSGSFAISNKNTILNKDIILIDDVLTTGTTFKEAKKILKLHGARKVLCLAIAH